MLLAVPRRPIAGNAGIAVFEHALVAAMVCLAGLGAFAALGRNVVDVADEAAAGIEPRFP